MKHIETAGKTAVLEAGLDRRAFMGRMGLMAGMGALGYAVPGMFSVGQAAAAAPHGPARPVVSVFMDLPYVDMTGRAEPYLPPRTYNVQARLTPGEDFGNYHYYV